MSESEDLFAPTRWEVIQDDLRSAGDGKTCFYCKEPLGGRHKNDCVIPQRAVRVMVKVEVLRRVPVSWDKQRIEFHMNDASWCADNIMDDMSKTAQKLGCLCHVAKFEYLGDAITDGPTK